MDYCPEKNDQVVLIFEDGMIEKPLVIGCIPRDKDSFLKKAVTEKNTKKQIQTRNGSRITFEDDENEDDDESDYEYEDKDENKK